MPHRLLEVIKAKKSNLLLINLKFIIFYIASHRNICQLNFRYDEIQKFIIFTLFYLLFMFIHYVSSLL